MSYRYIARPATEAELGTCSTCGQAVLLINVDNFKHIDWSQYATNDESVRIVCNTCAAGERLSWENQ